MPLRAWLHRFLVYEARNGGALPPSQLFPFVADSGTATEEVVNASVSTESAETGEDGHVLVNSASAPTAEREHNPSSRDSSSSSSSFSTPPPPPPLSPPPTAAITTTAKKKTVNVRDAGCDTATPADPRDFPRFYSRYVFLHTVTGLQLLWGYFSFALWNYLAHIRWYGASAVYMATTAETELTVMDGPGRVQVIGGASIVVEARKVAPDESGSALRRVANQWLAVAYLAFALAGLIYTVSAVLYVCVVNTPCHVRTVWPHPQLLMKACCPDPGLHPRDGDAADPDNDPFLTYGPPQRNPPQPQQSPEPPVTRTASAFFPGGEDDVRGEGGGVVNSAAQVYSPPASPPPLRPSGMSRVAPLSFTQPQFLFPLRRLNVLDRAAATGVRQPGREGDPLRRRFRAAAPLPASTDPHYPSQQYQQQQGYPTSPGHPSSSSFPPAPSPLHVYGETFTPPSTLQQRSQRQSQQPTHRGDPKAPLLWCACPLVIVLVVFDFMVIHGCRVRGWPVRLIQGLTPALGLLLILCTVKSLVVLCVRCCVVCWTAVPMAMYVPPRAPMEVSYGSLEPWVRQ